MGSKTKVKGQTPQNAAMGTMKCAVSVAISGFLFLLIDGTVVPEKPTASPYDCTNVKDGLYIGDCTNFYRCRNETVEMVPCPGRLVVNKKQMWCDYKDLVDPPCGTAPNCTHKWDGTFPDMHRGCKFYYTCYKEDFYGYTRCPGFLVFNPEQDICDWPKRVRPPCGTMDAVPITDLI